MALAFWGVSELQATIAARIGHVEGAGTPARNITRLTGFGVEVEWYDDGTLDALRRALIANSMLWRRIGARGTEIADSAYSVSVSDLSDSNSPERWEE